MAYFTLRLITWVIIQYLTVTEDLKRTRVLAKIDSSIEARVVIHSLCYWSFNCTKKILCLAGQSSYSNRGFLIHYNVVNIVFITCVCPSVNPVQFQQFTSFTYLVNIVFITCVCPSVNPVQFQQFHLQKPLK